MELTLPQIVPLVLGGFALGFISGYGARAYKSYRRRLRHGVWPSERLI